MPGAAGQLKKIYQQFTGGVVPTSTPAASTDVGGMVSYIAAGSVAAYNASTPTTPVMLHTFNSDIGPWMLMKIAQASANFASQSWTVAAGGANIGIYVPIEVKAAFSAKKMFCMNGGTAAGNVDIGLYTEAFAKVVSMGPTLQSGTTAIQEFDISDTPVAIGRYYLAISLSNATGTLYTTDIGTTTGISVMKGYGLGTQGSVGTLPSTITPSVPSTQFVPFFGMSSRTLVA